WPPSPSRRMPRVMSSSSPLPQSRSPPSMSRSTGPAGVGTRSEPGAGSTVVRTASEA
ncbi:MAG: hypothetical protein AVDCRST_MAG36-1363, partial [uncultured Nocardioidaceae bacterium]